MIKNLVTYINLNESYDQSTDDVNFIVDKILKSFKNPTQEMHTDITRYLSKFHELSGIDSYKYSNNPKERIIKIPYVYGEYLKFKYHDSDNLTNFKIEYRDPKTIIKYMGKKIIETGNGSGGRVTTADQEEATCVVWNNFLEDKTDYLDILSDKFKNFDKQWSKSCYIQVKTLRDKFFGNNKTCDEYRMVRRGSEILGSIYEKFNNAYLNVTNKDLKVYARIDNIDPSDVILYNKNKESEIVNILNNLISKCTSKKYNAAEIKELFTEQLYKSKLCYGVSLKKISGAGNIEIFNDPDKIKYGIKLKNNLSYKLAGANKKYIRLLVSSNINIPNIYVPGNGTSIQLKNILLTIRTFGAGTIAMDIQEKGKPAIGKCPTGIWRDSYINNPVVNQGINVASPGDWEGLRENALNFLNNADPDIIQDMLHDCVEGALKTGVCCLPFILIH